MPMSQVKDSRMMSNEPSFKPPRTLLSLPNVHAQEASCSADGILNGGYNFELAALAKKATRGKTTSDTFVYVGTNGGSVDPPLQPKPSMPTIDLLKKDLVPYLQVDGEYIMTSTRSSTCQSQDQARSVSFNTTGASTHIHQSLFTRGIYAAPCKIAPIIEVRLA